MTIAASKVLPRAPSAAPDAITLLPTRAALLERLVAATPSSHEVPAALLLIGLLHRDTRWSMHGSQLDRVAGALSADVRADDWLARSGPTEFAVLLNGAAADAKTAAHRLIEVVVASASQG